jgi:hypothetical protein
MKKHDYYWILIPVLFGSCNIDTGNYPDEPSIEYKSAEAAIIYDTLKENFVKTVKLHFYVIDGDGDIGIELSDTGTNVFMKMYHFANNSFSPDTAKLKYSIPYIDNSGQDETLKADIYIDIEYNNLAYDTIYQEFYITDRAGHRSNTEMTDTLVFIGSK